MDTPHLKVSILGLNYSPERTGIAPYTSSLARELRVRGHEVQVLTSFPHYPEWKVHSGYSGWSRSENVDGVRVKRFRHYVPSRPRGLLRLLSELSFGIRLFFAHWDKPDVVILISPALFSSALVMIRAHLTRSRPRLVIWAQDLYSFGLVETGQAGDRVARIMGSIESRTFRAADRVVVIHDRFSASVSASLGVHASRIRTIRNWSHIDPTSEFDRQMVRERYGWSPAHTVVLHAGNMGEKQALENVVEAARRAESSKLPILYVLLGDGSRRDALIEKSVGLANIQFIDSVEDGPFRELLGAADILLVNEKPGLAEMAVPSKLTSYFSAKRPVLAATDAGSITSEEIRVSRAGIRVDAGNPAALNAGVTEMISDPICLRQYGLSGFDFRQSFLSESAAIDSWEELLNSTVIR